MTARWLCLVVAMIGGTAAADGVPEGATLQKRLSKESVKVYRLENTLWLEVQKASIVHKRITIPRLCAPIRSIRRQDALEAEVKFTPEPTEWVFSWNNPAANSMIIQVVFDSAPMLPGECPIPTPDGDGSVMLHAHQAATFGSKLRFEPQWYKNTIGYWVDPTDHAAWHLKVNEPGTYSVAILQGCGEGQGGSDAVISLEQDERVKAELPFQTVDTGHFQNFRWIHLGHFTITDAGTYRLRIQPSRIAKAALCDIRAVHLVRQAKPGR